MEHLEMDKSYVYEIAGHFIEIVWKLPDGQNWQLPGFAPFLSEKMSKTDKECEATNSPENKLFTIGTCCTRRYLCKGI